MEKKWKEREEGPEKNASEKERKIGTKRIERERTRKRPTLATAWQPVAHSFPNQGVFCRKCFHELSPLNNVAKYSIIL